MKQLSREAIERLKEIGYTEEAIQELWKIFIKEMENKKSKIIEDDFMKGKGK